jgi:hypothetical protein
MCTCRHLVLWNRSATLPDSGQITNALTAPLAKYRGLWLCSRQRITRQQDPRSPEQPTALILLKRSEWLLHPSFSLSRFLVHFSSTSPPFPWFSYKTLRTKYETVLVLTGNPHRKAVAVDLTICSNKIFSGNISTITQIVFWSSAERDSTFGTGDLLF